MIEFGICLKEMKKLLYLSRCINAGGPGVATTAARAANTLPDYPPLTEQILHAVPTSTDSFFVCFLCFLCFFFLSFYFKVFILTHLNVTTIGCSADI